MLTQKFELFSDDLTEFGKNLTSNGKVNNPEMPFSKYNGAFTLDDNDFMVKLLSGDGNIQAASVAPMFPCGEIGERMFLNKEVNQGNVFFSMNGVDSGTYLLEVYVKLSNGSIGTFARGSVTVI